MAQKITPFWRTETKEIIEQPKKTTAINNRIRSDTTSINKTKKLTVWCKEHGIPYITAYRWFKAGCLPANAIQTATGTILVTDDLDQQTTQDKIHELSTKINNLTDVLMNNLSTVKQANVIEKAVKENNYKNKSNFELCKDSLCSLFPVDDMLETERSEYLSAETKKIIMNYYLKNQASAKSMLDFFVNSEKSPWLQCSEPEQNFLVKYAKMLQTDWNTAVEDLNKKYEQQKTYMDKAQSEKFYEIKFINEFPEQLEKLMAAKMSAKENSLKDTKKTTQAKQLLDNQEIKNAFELADIRMIALENKIKILTGRVDELFVKISQFNEAIALTPEMQEQLNQFILDKSDRVSDVAKAFYEYENLKQKARTLKLQTSERPETNSFCAARPKPEPKIV